VALLPPLCPGSPDHPVTCSDRGALRVLRRMGYRLATDLRGQEWAAPFVVTAGVAAAGAADACALEVPVVVVVSESFDSLTPLRCPRFSSSAFTTAGDFLAKYSLTGARAAARSPSVLPRRLSTA